MTRLLQLLRWLWWTIRTARHRDNPLTTDRPDWTHEELRALGHVRHPEQHLNNQAAADHAEEGR